MQTNEQLHEHDVPLRRTFLHKSSGKVNAKGRVVILELDPIARRALAILVDKRVAGDKAVDGAPPQVHGDRQSQRSWAITGFEFLRSFPLVFNLCLLNTENIRVLFNDFFERIS